MSDDFHPFAVLCNRLRETKMIRWEEHLAACEEAAKALERLSPLCKLVLDAIDADKRDAVIVRGEFPRQRYVTADQAVRALEAEIMRPHSHGKGVVR